MRPARRIADLRVTLIRRIMDEAAPDAVNLGLGMADADVAPGVCAAARAAIETRRAPYRPPAGLPALRERVGDSLEVAPDRVIITHGVQQGIALAMLGLVDPGDDVLFPDPGFPVYRTLAELAGGRAVAYALSREVGFRPRWEDIRAALTPPTRLVVLCSPGNPTGAVADADEWTRIGRGLAERGVAWLSDEIYRSLQHGRPGHGSMLDVEPAGGVVLGGMSKSHGMAGWRIGWLIAQPGLVGPLVALQQQLVTSASTLVQQAALGGFDAAARAGVERLAATLRDRREQAVGALEETGWSIVSGDGAFYLLVERPGISDDVALARHLVRGGVITIPGSAFGSGAAGLLRVSYSTPAGTLEEGIRRMNEAAETFASSVVREEP